MSVPPGTEMFQFPGFASKPYVFRPRYPRKGGFPHSDIRGSTIARISPRLFAACHVLHRLLAPRHPPNALITLEITPTTPARRTKPRPTRKTSSTIPSTQHTITHNNYAYLLTNQSIFTCQRTPAGPTSPAGRQRHAAVLETRPAPAGRTKRRMAEPCSPSSRPTLRLFSRIRPRQYGGNRIRTGDPLLAKQVLYQLSYAPTYLSAAVGIASSDKAPTARPETMGQGGLEPPTPRLSSVCSNQLSYWPPTSATPKPKEATAQPRPDHYGRRMRGRRQPQRARHVMHHQPANGHGDDWKALIIGSQAPQPDHPIRDRLVKGRSRSSLVIVQDGRSRQPKPSSHAHSLKGGDPAAGSPTATLLRLHPSH